MFNDYLDFLISSMQKQKYYVITSQCNGRDWFFFDVENENPPYRIAWAPRTSVAFKFPSEQDAKEFKDEFLPSRDTTIIEIEE